MVLSKIIMSNDVVVCCLILTTTTDDGDLASSTLAVPSPPRESNRLELDGHQIAPVAAPGGHGPERRPQAGRLVLEPLGPSSRYPRRPPRCLAQPHARGYALDGRFDDCHAGTDC